tara:strand:+ start:135 stop:704 length:570 start_codon:yes stop_codon:yes gene_type:complete
MVISLLNPKWTMPWSSKPKRIRGIGLYAAIAIACFIGFGLTYTPETEPKPVATEEPQEQTNETPQETIANSPTLNDAAIEAAITMLETAPPSRWFEMDRSEEAQADRAKFIEDATELGVIYKIEMFDNRPNVQVGASWNLLRFDEKQDFMNTLLTYYWAKDPEANRAYIFDAYSGKDIGVFDSSGLRLH